MNESAGQIVPGIAVEFCGEWHRVEPGQPFGIGRDAELAVDDNPFLHRRLLEIDLVNGLWLLSNVGSRLAVTVMDGAAGALALEESMF